MTPDEELEQLEDAWLEQERRERRAKIELLRPPGYLGPPDPPAYVPGPVSGPSRYRSPAAMRQGLLRLVGRALVVVLLGYAALVLLQVLPGVGR